MRFAPRLDVLVALAALAGASASFAQPNWTATLLTPAGGLDSQVNAVSGPLQAGSAGFLGAGEAPAVWSGSPGSLVTLPDRGQVWGMDGTTLVGGRVGLGATLWLDSGSTVVSLDPLGTTQSYARADRGEQQVGVVGILSGTEYRSHAALWRGSAGSWVDLNPAGAYQSTATSTDGVRQGGTVQTDVQGHSYAALWSGSAASVQNLNPPGSAGSQILGMAPGQQVGAAGFAGFPNGAGGAAIWSGTAESAIDVHPFPGYGSSLLLATDGSVQAGWSNVPGRAFPVAGVWSGTASSFVNLEQFLPTGYSGSIATSVTEYAGRIIVGGYAAGPNGRNQGFIWTRDVPAPPTAPILAFALAAAARRRRA